MYMVSLGRCFAAASLVQGIMQQYMLFQYSLYWVKGCAAPAARLSKSDSVLKDLCTTANMAQIDLQGHELKKFHSSVLYLKFEHFSAFRDVSCVLDQGLRPAAYCIRER